VEARVEFAAWLQSLPDNLQDSATAEALRAICDLDLSELQAMLAAARKSAHKRRTVRSGAAIVFP
jgi:hypothetical protein